MSWVDKGLYWAWSGSPFADCAPPAVKNVGYVSVTGIGRYLNGDKAGQQIEMKIAESMTSQIDFLKSIGAAVYP